MSPQRESCLDVQDFTHSRINLDVSPGKKLLREATSDGPRTRETSYISQLSVISESVVLTAWTSTRTKDEKVPSNQKRMFLCYCMIQLKSYADVF